MRSPSVVLRLASGCVLALGLAACSTTEAVYDSVFGSSETTPPPAEATGVPPADGQVLSYPDLTEVPARPDLPTSEAQRREIVDGLIADRERARYSEEELRGGAEVAAPPPAAVQGPPAQAPAVDAAPVPPPAP